jgi:hypothetical protein
MMYILICDNGRGSTGCKISLTPSPNENFSFLLASFNFATAPKLLMYAVMTGHRKWMHQSFSQSAQQFLLHVPKRVRQN